MNTFSNLRSLLLIIGLWLAVASVTQAGSLPDFTELVKKHSPAVVNISTTQKVTKRQVPFNIPDLPEDSPLREFFDRFLGKEGEEMEEFDAQSLGSGFIISEDGYVITNNHVVKDADEIIVRLSSRREYKAEVIGADKLSDIALLKIKAKNLPVVKLGKSEDMQVGEWVLAIGSPFGFDHSVTAGIVSAKGRSLPSDNYVPFIQTDVAINPGNSGGPLFNLDGEVVGVNSQIFSRTGGFMGLSFAIPIEVAMDVADQIKTKGKVVRGWLGVLIQDITQDLAESFGMKRPEGALISKVLPDSPASSAGFRAGDVIVEFDGHKIYKSSDLPPMVGRSKINTDYPMKIIRNGKKKTISVSIGELPDNLMAEDDQQEKQQKAGRLGLAVTKLSKEKRKHYGVDEHGVLVTQVTKGPAARAGIQQGDIILMLNNEYVRDVKHYEKLVDQLPADKSIPVLVQRRQGPVFLALRIDEEE